MSRRRDILDLDPYNEETHHSLTCHKCGRTIGWKQPYNWAHERTPEGKRTGKVLYFHKKCFSDAATVKPDEEDLQDMDREVDGKLITSDFDNW